LQFGQAFDATTRLTRYGLLLFALFDRATELNNTDQPMAQQAGGK
jgi:hypothetical protein